MTITLAHAFTSAKAQGADPTLVSKNEWNAQHVFSCASGVLIGRVTAAAGAAEELTPSSDFSLSAGAIALANPDIIRVLASDVVASDVNTAQAVFDTPTGFNAAASTTYMFDAVYWMVRSAGTTSRTIGLLFGGTATFTSIGYLAQTCNPAGDTYSAVSQEMVNVATNTALTAASTSATENVMMQISGIMRVNAAGTIIPQFQQSAVAGGALTVKANSFFRMRRLGTNTVTAVGSWS